MAGGGFLVGDWGGTRLRAWVLGADGAVLRRREFALGVNGLAPGEAARRFRCEVRPALAAESLPALLCGGVGSNVGWLTAPYVDCPADLAAVARALTRVPGEDPPVWIAPGLRAAGITAAPDVLRGEETQGFGWMALAPERARGRRLICLPGTHSKWLRLEDGRITGFVSAFAGEVFDLMTRHSLLRTPAPFADDPRAFDEGVAAAGDGGALLARLFAARGRVAGGGADPATTPSFLSGLLIGAECASLPALAGAEAGETVEIIGATALGARYEAVLARLGWRARIHDGEAAVLAGLRALAGTLEGT
jgi:2-dehydro-3-deoxygalactonokinase